MGSYALSQNISTTNNQNMPISQSDVSNPLNLVNASGNKVGSNESSWTFGNAANLNMLDGGAVSRAFDFGTLAISKLSDLTTQYNKQVSENSAKAVEAVVKNTDKLNSALTDSASGYDWTKNRNLLAAAVAVALAYLYFRK